MTNNKIPAAEDDRNLLDTLKYNLLRDKRYILYVGLITLLILLGGGILWSSGTQRLSANAVNMTVEPWYRGPEDAPVTIDLFPDFKCGICVEIERMAVQAADDFKGRIRLVYHHYPDAPLSEMIAGALEAAGEQGKFWEMHDRLIDNTRGDIYQVIQAAESLGLSVEEFTISKLVTEAENIGLDITQFTECLVSGRFKEKVRTAKQEAVSAGVKHASVFINGKEFRSISATYEDFYAAVNKELKKIGADGGDRE